jgi:predicted dehydrogenase
MPEQTPVQAATSPLRVGLIGYGLAGSAFHAPLIAAVPELRLAAVVTSSAERGRAARAKHPGVSVVADVNDLWRGVDALDLVVVATPNRTHVPLAMAALEAGLPVVVDKPIAAEPEDAARLIEEAARRRLLLSVFQNRRWDGDFLTVRRLLAEGRLGEVTRFESRFERWRPTPQLGWRERGDPEEAGGILYDLGSHLIDQALVLFGPAATVYAEIHARRSGVEVDDDAFVAITHQSGVRSHLWMSAVAAQLGARFRVLGDEAAYTKSGLDVQEARLRAGDPAGGAGWGEEPEERWGLLGAEPALQPVRTEPGDYLSFYAGVARALRDGTPPPVDPSEAVAALQVIRAARESAAENRIVPVPDE